jgi:hypothetical protein
MRRVIPVLAAMLMAGPAARGQVTVDLRALDALPQVAPAPTPPVTVARPAARRAMPAPASVRSPPPPPTAAAPPMVPAAAPAPPPPAMTAAPRVAPPAPAPLHLAFAPGAGFLSPAEVRAVGAYARALPPGAGYSILAYAPSSAQNPSAARRLALARALAVHDALRAAGIPPDHIRLRAMAPGTGGADNDRAVIDVSVSGSSP